MLSALGGTGERHDEAVAHLRALLLHAARFEVARRRTSLPSLRGDELDELAREAAADALVEVLRNLDDLRDGRRVSTWVYKFALREAWSTCAEAAGRS